VEKNVEQGDGESMRERKRGNRRWIRGGTIKEAVEEKIREAQE
jgi:hypothetical protein